MSIVINKIDELFKYTHIDEKRKVITIIFTQYVELNCALPKGIYLNCIINEQWGYTLNIIAKKITLNYYTEINNLNCENLVVNDILDCENIEVKNDIKCHVIDSRVLRCRSIVGYRVATMKILCKHLKLRALSTDMYRFIYVEAYDVNERGTDYDLCEFNL